MPSRIVSVTDESGGQLTTLERIKLELGITEDTHNGLLIAKLSEATSDIEMRIEPFRRATIVEEYWPESPRYGVAQTIRFPAIKVSRRPVVSINSIMVDDVESPPTDYRLDDDGQIYWLDSSGYPSLWSVSRLSTIDYIGGYLLPGEENRDLPPVLEAAVIELMTMFWMARGRDPMLKAEENPGVSRFEYWVGSVGKNGELPPSVMSKLSAFLSDPVFA